MIENNLSQMRTRSLGRMIEIFTAKGGNMKFLSLFFVLTAFSAQAERLSSRIHSVDYSRDGREPHLIQFENGRVGFLNSSDKASLLSLKDAERSGEWLDVELDGRGNFLGAGVIAPPELTQEKDSAVRSENMSYVPTNLGSYNEANTIFLRMRKRHQWSSQCYNRAHVWAYEEFNRSQLRSVKLFIFFTRSYIRKYRYKWWFHVTPMTYVNNTAMTLDRTFMRGPTDVKTWTDKFIHSKRNCPVVARYSEYRNNQETEHCYLIPATMYFWQPRDLEKYENTGEQKTQYIKSEVNWAYREAF